MSSVISTVAQVPSGGKNLFVPFNSNHGGFTKSNLLQTLKDDASLVISYDGTILNCTDPWTVMADIGNPVSISQGELYRDMGKSLHFQKNGVLVAIFRYAQLVNDTNLYYEGVPPSRPNIWICTWQSAGGNCPSAYGMVKVIRSA
jgi:hypothetical protein